MEHSKDVLAPVQMFQNEPFESGVTKAEPGDFIYYIEKLSVLVGKHGHSVSAAGWIVGFQCAYCGSILVSYKNLKLHEAECGHTAAFPTRKQFEYSLTNGAATLLNDQPDYTENYHVQKDTVQQSQENREDLTHDMKVANLQYNMATVKDENLSLEILPLPFVVEQSQVVFEADSSGKDKKQNVADKSMEDHFKSKKKGKKEKTHYCDFCGKIFFSVKFLDAHKPFCKFKSKILCKDYPKDINTQPDKPAEVSVQRKDCKDYFTSPGMLKRHSVIHTKERQLTCRFCANVFTEKFSLRHHEKLCELKNAPKKEVEKLKIQCSVCRKQFSSEIDCSKHLTEEHEGHEGECKAKVQYVCSVCKRSYAFNSGLQYHMRKHTMKYKYTCDTCGKTYLLQDSYRKHTKRCALPEDKQYMYKCTICPKAFKKKASLVDHERIHRGEFLFKCKVCQKHFLNNQNLKIHMKCAHSEERPFMCSKCGKCYPQQSTLNMHLKRHEGKRDQKCDVCGKAFMFKGQLNRHKIGHSDVRNYQCQQCPKAFKFMSELKRHEFTHTGIRPYKCKLCPMAFKTGSNLRYHEGTHTGFRKFECSICHEKFSVRATMLKHKESHSTKSEEEPPKEYQQSCH